MNCNGCIHWITKRVTLYGDGTEVVRYAAPDGKGSCGELKIETAADFGCNRFEHVEDAGHIETERIDDPAWQRFGMIACPDCGGRGSPVDGGACHRCAGTGKVRRYDDGYVGNEQTRKHPMEIERDRLAPKPPPAIDGTVLKPMPKPSVF